VTRRVYIDEDLTGRTLDASLAIGPSSDGHARESLFLRCNMSSTVLVGDWRGSDFLDCSGGPDLTRADVYAGYWRGCDLTGGLFPADIGFLHHEPVAEIIRAGAEARKARIARGTYDAFIAVADFVRADPVNASWDTSRALWYDTPFRDELVKVSREIYAPYDLAARFEILLRVFERNLPRFDGGVPSVLDVAWQDGASVRVDATDRPAVADLSRYTLARWVEAQADAQRPDARADVTAHGVPRQASEPAHPVFILTIVPLRLIHLATPDGWLERRHGY
jgi:hypothetical protein